MHNRFLHNTVLEKNETERQRDVKEGIQKKKMPVDLPVPKDSPGEKMDFSLAKTFRQLCTTLESNTQTIESTMYLLRNMTEQSAGYKLDSKSSSISGVQRGIKVKRQQKSFVEIKLTFMKINDIDTVTQLFEAEILVRAKWQEPLLTGSNTTIFDPENMWTPQLLVMNLDGNFSLDKVVYKVVHNAPGYKAPLVVKLWKFKGFFKESLELQHFPIDVQDLTISLTSVRSDEEVELIDDQCALSSVNTKSFQDAGEWDIYQHVETYQSKTTMEYASESIHPIFHAQCRVKRKMGYYIWNIMFIVALITVLTFATFSIEPSSADRLAVTITLLLTSVTFKLIVKQSLPLISYLTYLDLYVIAALVFLGLTSSQHAIIRYLSNFYKDSEVYQYDIYSIGCLLFIFIAFHVIFGVFIIFTAVKRRKTMVDKDKLYKAKREFIEHFEDNAKVEQAILRTMSKNTVVA